ncbi:unnamed protein product, partial [Rotaria sordida]
MKHSCGVDTINNIYLEVQHFEYPVLWANLVTRLYHSRNGSNDLVCADDQDKPVNCPYGV